jgi:tetratricopeptide (TPR) repeat protein
MANSKVEKRHLRGIKKTLAIIAVVIVLVTLFVAFGLYKTRAVRQRTSKAGDYYVEAHKYAFDGEYEKAISLAGKAMQLSPNFFGPYELRADSYEKIGDKAAASGANEATVSSYYQKAINDLKTEIGLPNQSNKMGEWNSMTILYMKLKQYAEAKKYASKLLADPQWEYSGQELLQEIDAKAKGSP